MNPSTYQSSPPPAIAYFVSHHGFGHAARASAIMAALQRRVPGLVFHIFTRTPEWFFADSLRGPFVYHPQDVDVGLVQIDSMHEDLPATLTRLSRLYPVDSAVQARLAGQLKAGGCRLVLCDVSAVGIAAAAQAGLPSVLIENFTWDWIYTPYLHHHPGFAPFIEYLSAAYRRAGARIQTQPVCQPLPEADLTSSPVSREPRSSREETRAQLGIDPARPVVMITMGGIPGQYAFLSRLADVSQVAFVIPGMDPATPAPANVVLLPHHSQFYHPDLIHAADVVVGKAGYSTVAETYHAGIPFLYLGRPNFRESEQIIPYIRNHMPVMELGDEEFHSGEWIARLPQALTLPRRAHPEGNGADQVAAFVLERFLSAAG
ncbi:MAG: hypothetical protein GYA17_03680 [Chloroflexi bacterium]|nr:hypothetical protein [Chloroflexota bacterium]